MPVWEAALVQIGFVGMGLGLPIALPTYFTAALPDAFAGRLGDGGEGSPRVLPWMAVVGAAVGLIWLYWAAGGAAGVAHRCERDLAWYVLSGVFGLWAFVACAATWAAVRGRPPRVPRWGPMVLGWLGSGSLFAWSGWKFPFTLYLAVAQPADAALPENLALTTVLQREAPPVRVGPRTTSAACLRSSRREREAGTRAHSRRRGIESTDSATRQAGAACRPLISRLATPFPASLPRTADG